MGYCFSSLTGKLYSLTLPQVLMHEYDSLSSEGRLIWSLANPCEIGPNVPRPPAELLTTGGPELYLSFKPPPPDAQQVVSINKAVDETVTNLKLSKRVEKTFRDLPVQGKLWVLQHFTPEAGADENDQMRTFLETLDSPWDRTEQILRVDTVGGVLGRHIADLSAFPDIHATKQCRISWSKKQNCFQIQALHGLVIVDGRELDRGEKVEIKNRGQIQLGRRCFMKCDVRNGSPAGGDDGESEAAVAQPIVETSGGAFGLHSNYARRKMFGKTEDEIRGERARAERIDRRCCVNGKRRLEGLTGWKEGLREAKLRREERELEQLEVTEETEAMRESKHLNMNLDGSYGGAEAEAERPGLGYSGSAGPAPRSLLEKRMMEVASGASKPSVTGSNPFRMSFVKSSTVLNGPSETTKKKQEEEEVDIGWPLAAASESMARFLRKFIHHEARTGSTLQSFLKAQRPDLDTVSLLLRHLSTAQLGDRKTPQRIMDVVAYLREGDTLCGHHLPGRQPTPPSPTALAHVALGVAAAVNHDIAKAELETLRSLVADCVTRGLDVASGKDLPLMSTAMYRTEVRDIQLWTRMIGRAADLLEGRCPSDHLDARGLVGIVFGLSKMAINAPRLERHLPEAAALTSPQARAQLLYVRCRMQKNTAADIHPDITALANSLAREADRESYLLALHSISLIPYRHEGLLSRGVEGDPGGAGRGWSAGSYLRYIADCFRLSCPVTSTALPSLVSRVTYESFFLYGLRFMGWDDSRAQVPPLQEIVPSVAPTVLPAESAAMVLAAFQICYFCSVSRDLGCLPLEALRRLKRCIQFEVDEVAPQPRYQIEVDEVLRAMPSRDFRVLREIQVEPLFARLAPHHPSVYSCHAR
ncbi:hypothetical protein FOZ60_016299 [Perkinsus olseni]|uniref:Uncharacterized protein n=1 Tax=Perkinsus olseni TaxID=32597 RepID=A0A7J6P5D6_PEROL|nr:hypothetical protein FOZ60_016299 [Perkinsus olseni]